MASDRIMNLESILETYGYLAISIGTFLEGETILVLGGFAAHQGYLALPGVIAAAFIGSLLGDQLFFYLGRTHSRKVLDKRPSWKLRAEKVHKLLDRFNTPLILSFRFLYGLRTVAPFVIGMSPVSVGRFVVLNSIGALVWALAVGSGGYFFGQLLESALGKLKHYELRVIGVVAVIGVLVWIAHFALRKKKPA